MVRCAAISQPTYLPWIGWFDIFDQADQFVVLDSVQFERHSWQHRNRICGKRGEILLSVPVRQTGLATPILSAQIADRRAVAKHLVTIAQTYATAPHRDELLALLEPVYADIPELLVDLNLSLINAIAGLLGITTPTMRAASLNVSGAKDHLVRQVCEELGATEYLSASGSRGYLEAGSAFADGALTVRYHSYVCREYPQRAPGFTPYMSAIDVIANVGDGARAVMIDGRRQ